MAPSLTLGASALYKPRATFRLAWNTFVRRRKPSKVYAASERTVEARMHEAGLIDWATQEVARRAAAGLPFRNIGTLVCENSWRYL